MARDTRVVVVDLAASSPTISEVSVDTGAPGLAELMQGEASFFEHLVQVREHAFAEQTKLKPDPVGDFYQGGTFCGMEFDGDRSGIFDLK